MAYSDSMVRAIRAQAPLNLEKAHALGAELGGELPFYYSKSQAVGGGVCCESTRYQESP